MLHVYRDAHKHIIIYLLPSSFLAFSNRRPLEIRRPRFYLLGILIAMLLTVTCIVALGLGLFAELGGCTPELHHNRRSLDSTSPDRNVVDLTCREDGSEILATFWNGSTPLNPTPSAGHTHTLTAETEAGIVCRNEKGVPSNEIKLAGSLFNSRI